MFNFMYMLIKSDGIKDIYIQAFMDSNNVMIVQ